MHHQRSLDVTESRVGLSLFICLLLAIGYMVLERLGGTGQAPPVEVRAGFHAQPTTSGGESSAIDPQQPHVLTIEGSDVPAPPTHTSQQTAPSAEPPAPSQLR